MSLISEKHAELYNFYIDGLEELRDRLEEYTETPEEQEIFCYASITDLLSYLRAIKWERDDVGALLSSALTIYYPVTDEHA